MAGLPGAAWQRWGRRGGHAVGALLGLAAPAVAIGVAPVVAVRPALAVGEAVGGAPVAAAGLVGATAGMISLFALGVIALLGLGAVGAGVVRRRRPVGAGATWGCGYALPSPRMQYTASSFAAPLLALFGPLAGVHTSRSADGAAFHSEPRELVLDTALVPAWHRLRAGLARMRTIQHGRLWVYLVYLIAALLALLLYLTGFLGTVRG